jgi:acetoacetyl-CoA synthetase
MPAVVSRNEAGRHRELSWPELRRQVAALALHLKARGVGRGDRVAAYLPNIPEAMVAFLATASLGAVWSICAPDMGTNAVLDRFRQIAPKALIAVDGVHYAGRDIDRRAVLAELRAGLPSVEQVVLVPNLDLSARLDDAADYVQVTARVAVARVEHVGAAQAVFLLHRRHRGHPDRAVPGRPGHRREGAEPLQQGRQGCPLLLLRWLKACP